MSEHVEHGFGPVWDGESRVLILGSMPSPKSRAAAYSRGEHPRERQQVEEGRGGQAECGRVDGGKRHGTGDRPRNQRSDHHGAVFQIDSLCGAFGFVVAVQPTAQLVSEHDGEVWLQASAAAQVAVIMVAPHAPMR